MILLDNIYHLFLNLILFEIIEQHNEHPKLYNHENYEWYRLLNNKDILGIELDSENYKPTELVEQFINVIKEEKNNSKILKKANM